MHNNMRVYYQNKINKITNKITNKINQISQYIYVYYLAMFQNIKQPNMIIYGYHKLI